MKKPSIKIVGYCYHSADLNLAREFKRTIVRAFTLHPTLTMVAIAGKLGISERSLYTACTKWHIVRKPKKTRISKPKFEDSKYFR